MRPVTCSIPAEVRDTAHKEAAADGVHLTEWVNNAVSLWAWDAHDVARFVDKWHPKVQLPHETRRAILDLYRDHPTDRRPLDVYLYLLQSSQWPVADVVAVFLPEDHDRIGRRINRGRKLVEGGHPFLPDWLSMVPDVPWCPDQGEFRSHHMVTVTYRFSDAVHARLKLKARTLGWTLGRAVTTALGEVFERRDLDINGRPLILTR